MGTGAELQFKQLIDRILRCREAEDEAKADTKEVYAELKSLGYDKTAAGALVAELRKKDKDAAGFEERSAILDLYRETYERASGTVVATHVHTREESQAKASEDNGSITGGAGAVAGEASRVGAGRTASATSDDGRDSRERPAPVPRSMSISPLEPREAGGLKGFGFTVKFEDKPTAMTAKTKADVMRLLRPFCQHLEDSENCGGSGSKHCYTCQLLADTARATA